MGRIGSGGMGVVHAGLAPDGQRAAVKVIQAEYAGDPSFRARFAREVKLMRRVDGPCLVPLLDADANAGQPWLATPFVPGPTLSEYLRGSGPLSGVHLHALAAGVAGALAAVHAAGIVHRDLKPGNVILAPDGPRVLDFGIAHALDETAITRTGSLTGTPGWSSPEQYRGEPGGPAADVFAWGALVAHAATGRHPFGTGAPDVLAYRIVAEEPDLAGVPEELLPHVTAALAKDPAERPASARLAEHVGALFAADATVAAGAGPEPTPTVVDGAGPAQAIADAWTLSRVSPPQDTPWDVPPDPVSPLAPDGTAEETAPDGGQRRRRRTALAAVIAAVAAAAIVILVLNLLPSGDGGHPTAAPSTGSSIRTATASRSSGCVPVHYKTADGPADCAALSDVCALGAPLYTPDIDKLCGQAPQASIYVSNTGDPRGPDGCLVLDGTGWATGTVDYKGTGRAAADCNGWIDRTAADDGGIPLKSCQQIYPHTRTTFLATLQMPGHRTTTACISANSGA
ncbi:serine/threonine-protein kinase [Streptomyces sp. NRRL S-813]|uniref:serine/threonine-protein kinase n=1 Tax=Streptomyces sp. NRRL S-813 TaxID=1463919 RepID=UPI001F325A93|nr:serine/threonine-protein kinase [Streptomyces sp. NRRL S-813]